nr:MAG TPA: hypothetical protein [Caudoviricetes sp.]
MPDYIFIHYILLPYIMELTVWLALLYSLRVS